MTLTAPQHRSLASLAEEMRQAEIEWDDEINEPIGSCEECGVNLYEDDDPYLCDQCDWAASQT